jgi:hypothetical protein
MPAANLALVPHKPTARSRVSNGSDLLPGIDVRSATARRYRDILAALASDQGGADRMGEARTQLCRRFAALAVQAEALEARLASGETIDLQQHALLCSTLTRLASRIGIDRVARDIGPSLAQILSDDRRQQATGEAAGEEGAERPQHETLTSEAGNGEEPA